MSASIRTRWSNSIWPITPIDRQTDAGVSAELFNSYPAAVQQRLGYLTRQYRVLTGNELISLGIRNCNGSDRTMIASAGRDGAPTSRRPAVAGRPIRSAISPETVRGAVAAGLRPSDARSPQGPIRVAVAERRPARPLPPARDDGLDSRRRPRSTRPAAPEAAPATAAPPAPSSRSCLRSGRAPLRSFRAGSRFWPAAPSSCRCRPARAALTRTARARHCVRMAPRLFFATMLL